ncbi:ATP-binding cassette domain-containing protein [Alphaproteobacteria bacterium LSUCC0684]
MADPFLSCSGLTRVFDLSSPWLVRKITGAPEHHLVAVDDVSFAIPRGRTYALVGESGSGKSTIARMVVGLLRPHQGVISVDGHDLNDGSVAKSTHDAVRQKLQMVFQSPYSSLNPRWRVGDILAEPIRAFGLIDGDAAQQQRVRGLLEQVGLSASDAGKYPHEFSGGQRQRISIARALASNPAFIVCDEPTSALDVSVQAQVLNLLKQLQKELGLTYLFISHDMAVVRVMAHHVGVLKNGRLIEENSADALFSNPEAEYTRTLINSTPRIRF